MQTSQNLPVTAETTVFDTAAFAATLAPAEIAPSEPANPPLVFQRPKDVRIKQSTIMIVDDEESVVLAIQAHLRHSGFQHLLKVTDATRALTEMRQLAPDLILLDLHMPVHGLDVLASLRRDESFQHLPVIILTSETAQAVRIRALELGADDFISKPVDPSELVVRVRNTLARKILQDQLLMYSKALQSDVLRDDLTQIANRRAFEYELNRRIIEWSRQRTPLSLLLVDVDHFKRINDQVGRLVGDHVLQRVAQHVQFFMRAVDLVAQFGGEELAVILPNTDFDDAKLAGERIRTSIAERVWNGDGHELHITVSVGVATALPGDQPQMIVERADEALCESKRLGRNLTCYHDGHRVSRLESQDLTDAASSWMPDSESSQPSFFTRRPNLESQANEDSGRR